MKNGLDKIKMRLPAVALLGASLLFWGLYDRYEPAGPVLLENPTLADGSRVRGMCTETNGHFTLTVPEGGGSAGINFRLPGAADYQLIRVRGRIKVNGVVEGKHPWSCARLLLTQYNRKNRWVPGHHSLKAESGTHDWISCKQQFKILPGAVNADVVIQHIGVKGTAEFDRIVAEPVQLKTSFMVWWLAFAGSWVYMGVLFFRRCRLDRRKLRILILLNALAILTGTLMPEKWIEDVSKGSEEMVMKIKPSNPPVAQHSTGAVKADRQRVNHVNEISGDLHRLGHYLLFASLCFLIFLSAALERQHPSYFFKVMCDMLLFAAITESLQYLTLDRIPGVSDWLTDVYGVATAFLLFVVLLSGYRLVTKSS